MKNWLFIGQPIDGQHTTSIDTTLQNCKNHVVDPQAYFSDALERRPRN